MLTELQKKEAKKQVQEKLEALQWINTEFAKIGFPGIENTNELEEILNSLWEPIRYENENSIWASLDSGE